MKNVLKKYKPQINTNIIIQPAWGTDTKKIWEWAKKDDRFRLMLQVHKVIWSKKRGI
jgi:organic radical activating enzyme